MNKRKGIITAILVFCLCLGMVGGAAEEPEIVMSELNPEYEKYLANIQQLPCQIDLETEEGDVDVDTSADSYIPAVYTEVDSLYALENTEDTLPASYDARTTGRITDVGDQGQHGLCWAFAGNSSLEAALMPEQEYNFSEQHVRFSLSSHDGNTCGYDRESDDGGNFNMYATYLMRWSGPVLESDDPYDLTIENRDVSVTNSFEKQFHVQGYSVLPNPATNVEDVTDAQRQAHVNLVKQYVMEYGSVFTSVYYNAAYLNPTTNAYYYRDKNYYYNTMYRPCNHALSIIGWDDHYSKENFKPISTDDCQQVGPSSDGAFLIKNSWGEDFGENGYFYLSYEDVYAGWEAGVIDRVDSVNNFDHIYQYDAFCVTGATGFYKPGTTTVDSKACFANVFSTGSEEEALKAISVYALAPNTTCTVYVNSVDGTLQSFSEMEKVAVETFPMSGYHTINLDRVVPLTGEHFVIAVHVESTTENQLMVPLEARVTTGDITNKNCSSNPGESFFSYNSSVWRDTEMLNAEANVMLKAYTVDVPQETTLRFANEAELLDGWENGEKVKADSFYYNNGDEAVTAKTYLGLYQGNKLMSLVSSAPVTIQPGGCGQLVTDTLTVPNTGEYHLRQFVWDVNTLWPLTSSEELQKKAE